MDDHLSIPISFAVGFSALMSFTLNFARHDPRPLHAVCFAIASVNETVMREDLPDVCCEVVFCASSLPPDPS